MKPLLLHIVLSTLNYLSFGGARLTVMLFGTVYWNRVEVQKGR